MLRTIALVAALLVAACDSSDPNGGDPASDPGDPSGTFTIDPIWFRLSRVAEPDVGGVEDLQAWLDGSVDLTANDGTLSGTGSCTVRRRRHRAWIPETTDESETRSFTATGSITGGDVVLTLQGCAWAMARYTGTFSDGTYDLALRDLQSAPVWDPSIYTSSTRLDGDDPRDLTLVRSN